MVILKNPKEFIQTFKEPEETHEVYVNNDDIDSDDEVTDHHHNQQQGIVTQQQSNETHRHGTSRSRRNRNTQLPKATHFNKHEGRRARGNRHARRHENMCYLLSLVEDAELDLDDEIKYDDIVRPQMSAFAKLMLEEKSLQIWNDFISRSGQEQDEIINYAEKINTNKRNKRNKRKERFNSNCTTDDSLLEEYAEYYTADDERVKNYASTTTTNNEHDFVDIINDYCLREKCVRFDKRISNSENRFKKIDKHIRKIMQRQVAMEVLETYEDTLVSTFSASPDSVYISKLPTSFDRLLMHGICQYFDLNAKSFDKDGQRHTQVENNRNIFKLKSLLLLTDYIKFKFNMQQVNTNDTYSVY